MLKYDVEHPVINDCNFKVWRNFDIHCWPSVLLVGPSGHVVYSKTGEGILDTFEPLIEVLYDYYKEDLNEGPLPEDFEINKLLASEQQKLDSGKFFSIWEENAIKSRMRFPSKLLYTEETGPYDSNGLLVVSDSGNNRILIIDEESLTCIDSIGTGNRGDEDGSFEECSLYHPQGAVMARSKEDQEILIICDTKNHKMREANLRTR